MKTLICTLTILLFSIEQTSTAQVTGSGNPGRIPIWSGSNTPSKTLGNSTIFETQGMVGIDTTSPTAILHVVGGGGLQGQNAPVVLKVSGGVGGSGSLSIPAGAGGSAQVTSGTGGFPSGTGGTIQLLAGPGGSAGGGCVFPPCRTIGGPGGSIQINAGRGGPGNTSVLSSGGNGGSITIQPGAGGARGGSGGSGIPGNVLLAPNLGNVGIGEIAPTNNLEVRVGGTTLADAWTVRSSLRFKTNIQPLGGALEKIEQLQGVTYARKDDGKPEIGVIAEDVEKVVPEVVSRDPDTNEIQGVDYSRLAALLIEAVKTQQAEIQQLKARLEELTSKGRQ